MRATLAGDLPPEERPPSWVSDISEGAAAAEQQAALAEAPAEERVNLPDIPDPRFFDEAGNPLPEEYSRGRTNE